MRSRLPLTLIALSVAAVVALIAAGCGSSDDSSSTSTSASSDTTGTTSSGYGSGGGGTASSASAPSGPATVAVANNPKLGQIVVDGKGMTLYLFEKDDESDESYCNGKCADVWPPLTTSGSPQVKVPGGKVTTFKREDGTTQVAFDGHPLYYYVKDTKPGDATGNELDLFGAEWYALQPNGKNAE